jgi:hypothetical protein
MNDPEIARSWAALERDAKTAGIKVPGFQEFLELQGKPRDADEELRAAFLS